MHIGTARTAYFNWLAAKASGGKFLLRIDDTDQKRNDPAYTQVILDTMDWLGLKYDELVYQSHRFPIYNSAANFLISEGWAKEREGAIVFTWTKYEASVLLQVSAVSNTTARSVARQALRLCALDIQSFS
jgi:hypothetical protein